MRRLLTSAIAASALVATAGAVAPAAAQTWGYDYPSGRAEALQSRIDSGVRDGSLTWSQARQLRRRVDGVQRTEQRYRDDGMAGWQARSLDRSYDDLSAEIRADRNNGYSYHRRSWWDRW